MPEQAPKLQMLFDRFVRLLAAAKLLEASGCDGTCRILHLGATSDDLTLFLPTYDIVAAPFNTAEDMLAVESFTDDSFDAVVTIGEFEYFSTAHRAKLIKEQMRLAGSLCLVDFPNSDCLSDWLQLLEITCSSQVATCLLTGLPFAQNVMASYTREFEQVKLYTHTDRTSWLSFSALAGLNNLAARMISPQLNLEAQEYSQVLPASDDEKVKKCAYNLVVAKRA
ncbi:MAG: hypothetical protein QG625_2029 [Cyanobacteriota bacterium erpe_2018_sw_39hr_WHONDRS-SW48-000098_B_bin.30]|nr:hypothetical protein [Cyanobacteriota bacterium erpe_2018_sw_39hr_WHONDRS-SW48-000098_B_bin.30]